MPMTRRARARAQGTEDIINVENVKVTFATPKRHQSSPAIFQSDAKNENDDENGPLMSDIACRLNFTRAITAPTPGRYLTKHRVGEPLKVFLRIRPLDDQHSGKEVISVTGQTSVSIKHSGKNDEAKFCFSHVFPSFTSQQEVYKQSGEPLLRSFVRGQNGLLYAYGITNSGKTHTIVGTPEEPGILPQLVSGLFMELGDAPQFDVWVSYLEIYNEKIYDLLADNASHDTLGTSLKMQSDAAGNVFVTGLSEVVCDSEAMVTHMITKGRDARAVADTVMNSHSSRSHAVFTLKLVHKTSNLELEGAWSKLSVVDLAGSERTQRTNTRGKRLQEAVKINNSLVTLGRCLEALQWNQDHPESKPKRVPFRDSQVTRLFKDSLLGWGRTVMIANVNPAASDLDETMHALKYASLASEIRTAHRIDNTNPYANPANRPPTRSKRVAEKSVEDLKRDSMSPTSSSSSDGLVVAGGGGIKRGRHGIDLDAPTLSPPKTQGEHLAGTTHDTEALLDQIYDLKQHIVCLEATRVTLEAEIRNEVAEEVAAQMEEMETLCDERVQHQKQALEEKFERKMLIWKKDLLNQLKTNDCDDQVSALSHNIGTTQEELLKKTVDALHVDHARELRDQEEAFEIRVSTLKEKHEAMEGEHAEALEAEKKRAQEHAQSLEMEVKQWQSMAVEMKAVNDSLSEDLETVQRHVDELRSDKTRVTAELEQVQKSAQESEKAWKDTTSKFKELQRECTLVVGKNEQATIDIEVARKELQSVHTKLQEHEDTVATMENELTQAKALLNDKSEEHQQSLVDLEQMAELLRSREEEINTLHAEYATSGAHHEATLKELEMVRNSETTTKEQLTLSLDKNQQLSNELEQALVETQEALERMQQLERANAEREQRVLTLESEANSLGSQLRDTVDELKTTRQKLQVAENELHEARSTVTVLEDALTQQKILHQVSEESIAKMQEQERNARQEMQRHSDQNTQIMHEHQQLKMKLEAAKKEVEQIEPLKKQLAEYQEQLATSAEWQHRCEQATKEVLSLEQSLIEMKTAHAEAVEQLAMLKKDNSVLDEKYTHTCQQLVALEQSNQMSGVVSSKVLDSSDIQVAECRQEETDDAKKVDEDAQANELLESATAAATSDSMKDTTSDNVKPAKSKKNKKKTKRKTKKDRPKPITVDNARTRAQRATAIEEHSNSNETSDGDTDEKDAIKQDHVDDEDGGKEAETATSRNELANDATERKLRTLLDEARQQAVSPMVRVTRSRAKKKAMEKEKKSQLDSSNDGKQTIRRVRKAKEAAKSRDATFMKKVDAVFQEERPTSVSAIMENDVSLEVVGDDGAKDCDDDELAPLESLSPIPENNRSRLESPELSPVGSPPRQAFSPVNLDIQEILNAKSFARYYVSGNGKHSQLPLPSVSPHVARIISQMSEKRGGNLGDQSDDIDEKPQSEVSAAQHWERVSTGSNDIENHPPPTPPSTSQQEEAMKRTNNRRKARRARNANRASRNNEVDTWLTVLSPPTSSKQAKSGGRKTRRGVKNNTHNANESEEQRTVKKEKRSAAPPLRRSKRLRG